MPPRTPAGKARALANLAQFRHSPVVSGAFAVLPADAIAAKEAEVRALLTGDAAGWLRPSDAVSVGLLARVLVRLDAIDTSEAFDRWLRRQTSSPRPRMTVPAFAQVYLRLLALGGKFADALGLSPSARNRIGLSAATTQAVVTEKALREHARAAGLDLDGDDGATPAVAPPVGSGEAAEGRR